jgi:hypothetical protein
MGGRDDDFTKGVELHSDRRHSASDNLNAARVAKVRGRGRKEEGGRKRKERREGGQDECGTCDFGKRMVEHNG